MNDTGSAPNEARLTRRQYEVLQEIIDRNGEVAAIRIGRYDGPPRGRGAYVAGITRLLNGLAKRRPPLVRAHYVAYRIGNGFRGEEYWSATADGIAAAITVPLRERRRRTHDG